MFYNTPGAILPDFSKINFKRYLKVRYLILAVIVILLVLISALFLTIPDVSYLKNEKPSTTALIEIRKQQAHERNSKFYLHQNWVALIDIPELLQKTIRITEDSGFYDHNGVDWTELKESVVKNFEKGEYARGGSTITQQLSKNLFLSTEKSIFRKLKEILITFKLEDELSKSRILYLYLNIIEFGPGVFGVQAASQYYFMKNVQDLTLEEMIRLTAIIPQPLKINAAGNSKWLMWKCRWILNKLLLYKYISDEEYNLVLPQFQ